MKKENKMLLIGAHMSVTGGFHEAITRGASIGCTAIQIFTKSNRQWHAKEISEKDATLFKETLKQNPIISIVVAHASYLINIASPDAEISKKSVTALISELERCNLLKIPYLILHPGSRSNSTEDEAIMRIVQNLDAVFKAYTGSTKILIETMAGQGSVMGSSFTQIAQIIKEAQCKRKLGVCLDTCHAFAAGYDMSHEKGYEDMWATFDKKIGLNKLKVIHVNDSKKECKSHVDRHADIGKGLIGKKGFELLFNDPRFFDIPKILETPKETLEDDVKNLRIIKELLSVETQKKLKITIE